MQIPQRNTDNGKNAGQRWPTKTYFIILFTTIALIAAMTIALFAVLLIGSDSKPSDNDQWQDDLGGNNDQFGNINSLYPTTPSRDNYISASNESVIQIGDAIQSNNTILVDLSNYTSVAEKGADQTIYPASMTKVMTLLVACENVTSLTKKLVVTQEDIDYKNENGGSGLLVASSLGDGFTIEDLLYMISYKSDTIACLMIAKEIAGSEENFV